MFEAMNRAIALHRLRPVVDRVFPLADVAGAYAALAAGGAAGKIVLAVGGAGE